MLYSKYSNVGGEVPSFEFLVFRSKVRRHNPRSVIVPRRFPPLHTKTNTYSGAAAMKDIEWSTWTLPFGWAARGVWPTAGNDPGSEVTCAKRSGDSSLLAAGDNFG